MSNFKTSNIFGNILSEVFSFIEVPDNTDNNYFYIISFITKSNSGYYLLIKKMKFSLDNYSLGFQDVKSISIYAGGRRIVSCYFTVVNKYICFYQSKSYKLRYLIFPITSLSSHKRNDIYDPGSVSLF